MKTATEVTTTAFGGAELGGGGGGSRKMTGKSDRRSGGGVEVVTDGAGEGEVAAMPSSTSEAVTSASRTSAAKLNLLAISCSVLVCVWSLLFPTPALCVLCL